MKVSGYLYYALFECVFGSSPLVWSVFFFSGDSSDDSSEEDEIEGSVERPSTNSGETTLAASAEGVELRLKQKDMVSQVIWPTSRRRLSATTCSMMMSKVKLKSDLF